MNHSILDEQGKFPLQALSTIIGDTGDYGMNTQLHIEVTLGARKKEVFSTLVDHNLIVNVDENNVELCLIAYIQKYYETKISESPFVVNFDFGSCYFLQIDQAKKTIKVRPVQNRQFTTGIVIINYFGDEPIELDDSSIVLGQELSIHDIKNEFILQAYNEQLEVVRKHEAENIKLLERYLNSPSTYPTIKNSIKFIKKAQA
ncbi:TPA: hypothetical protein ACJEU7_003035 [Acinetobacter baumannii]